MKTAPVRRDWLIKPGVTSIFAALTTFGRSGQELVTRAVTLPAPHP
jgi:hypothetical protein